jgi:hypothetical protein
MQLCCVLLLASASPAADCQQHVAATVNAKHFKQCVSSKCSFAGVMSAVNCCISSTAGGAFSLAYGGSALNTIGKIKSQIMLNGGVITSIAMSPAVFARFKAYSSQSGVFDTTEDLSSSRNVGASEADVYMHALFCYGWRDTANGNGDWLCKNR